MKRFYTDVTVLPEASGLGIALDGRPVRTPARAPLLLPTPALAKAVAAEWRAQGDMIDPAAMPFTGLANAAIDHVAPDPSAFADGIARYAHSDLLCYRADAPETSELSKKHASMKDSLKEFEAHAAAGAQNPVVLAHAAKMPAPDGRELAQLFPPTAVTV